MSSQQPPPPASAPSRQPAVDFYSKFGHEVRSPLNAIIGFSEMLSDGAFGELAEQQREVVGDILAAGRNLRQLVSDFMDLHKIQHGLLSLTIETLSLAQVIEQTIFMVSGLAADREIAISNEVSSRLAVSADERRLVQVVRNLLHNGIRYSPSRGRVEISAREVGSLICLRISDCGHGIPEAEQELVFAPFAAVDRDGQQAGPGLGLPLSRGLAEAMGGEVRLINTPGAGCTVEVSLPAAKPPE